MFKNKNIWVGLALVIVLLGVLLFDIYGRDSDSETENQAVEVAVDSKDETDHSHDTITPTELEDALLYENIPYVDSDPNPRQIFDIYVPKDAGDEQLPVLLWIHGGAWISGDKADPPIRDKVADGFIVVSMNYRLSPTYLNPSQVMDVKAAIRYLKGHGNEFNVDPDRIALIGHSAGAHLALLAGLTSGEGDFENLFMGHQNESATVKTIIASAPPVDFTTIIDHAEELDLSDIALVPGASSIEEVTPEILLTGCVIEQCPDDVAKTNPINYLDANDPSVFLQHGESDDVVPYLQSSQLDEALRAAGLTSELKLIESLKHDFIITDELEAWLESEL